jgi:hypothetical protein
LPNPGEGKAKPMEGKSKKKEGNPKRAEGISKDSFDIFQWLRAESARVCDPSTPPGLQ